jgi:hypothetical protein
MDCIPQVFELARISRSSLNAHPRDFVLTYEDFERYASVYRELPQSAKQVIDDLAYARRTTNKKSNADS